MRRKVFGPSASTSQGTLQTEKKPIVRAVWLTGAEGSGKSVAYTLLKEFRIEKKDTLESQKGKLKYLSFEVFQSFISILSNWEKVLPDVKINGTWSNEDVSEMKKSLRDLISQDELPSNFRIKREWLHIMQKASRIKGFQDFFVKRHFLPKGETINIPDGLKELLLSEQHKWSILGEEMPPKALYKYIRFPNSAFPRKTQPVNVALDSNPYLCTFIDIPGRAVGRADILNFFANAESKYAHPASTLLENAEGLVFYIGISDFDVCCSSQMNKFVWIDGFEYFLEIVRTPSFSMSCCFALSLTKSDIFEEKMIAIEDPKKEKCFNAKLDSLRDAFKSFLKKHKLSKLPERAEFPSNEDFKDIGKVTKFLHEFFGFLFDRKTTEGNKRMRRLFKKDVLPINLVGNSKSDLTKFKGTFKTISDFFQRNAR